MKKHIRYFLAAFLATIAGVGAAATFNLFQPAAGILKGNPSTYVTTAAASTDVISLWSGTCNATSFLRGDGSCAPALSGTVPVGNGGTGATSLTGVLKGNGTSPVTSAASTDVISLWSGTCSASTFLRGDGSCQAAGATPAGANTQIQFNNAGAFGAESDFTYDTTGNILTVGNNATVTASNNPAGAGFNLTLTGGSSTGASTGSGGNLFAMGGNTSGAGLVGGSVFVQGGQSSGAGGQGGGLTLTGGEGDTGGVLSLGAGTSNNGVGANVELFASSGTGTNSNGGNILIGAGAASGSGTIGNIELQTGGNPRLTIGGNGAWTLAGSTGTAGQVLTSNGAAGTPTWQAAGGGGGPTLAGNNVWTGTFNEWENAAPLLAFDETDAAANERSWLMRSSSGILALSTATDAAPTTAVANAITIDRNGTTVTNVNLQATAVQANGSTIITAATTPRGARFNANGSGCSLNTGDATYFTACSRLATGNFLVSLGSRTACVANADPTSGSGHYAAAINGGGPNMSVNVFGAGGTAVDGGFSLVCALN